MWICRTIFSLSASGAAGCSAAVSLPGAAEPSGGSVGTEGSSAGVCTMPELSIMPSDCWASCSAELSGSLAGASVGTGVGSAVGTGVGVGVGATVGTGVGTGVGATVGATVGAVVVFG